MNEFRSDRLQMDDGLMVSLTRGYKKYNKKNWDLLIHRISRRLPEVHACCLATVSTTENLKKEILKSGGVPNIRISQDNDVPATPRQAGLLGDVVSVSFKPELIAMFRQRSV